MHKLSPQIAASSSRGVKLLAAFAFLALAAAPVLARQPPQAQQPSPQGNITITGQRKDLDLVIRDYIATYTARSPIGRVSRWDEPICPGVIGLERSNALFVVERVRAIAAKVGVRVNAEEPCQPNILIVISRDPQDFMAAVREKAPGLLGYHFPAELNALTAFNYPVQAWYGTATRDHSGTVFLDTTDDCVQVVPDIDPYLCKFRSAVASRIRDDDSSVFQMVIIVADASKITGLEIGAVTDYIAMLALSQTKAFDSCSPLPSIHNLFASGCDPALRTKELSENDMAYLDALYTMSAGMLGRAEHTEIRNRMLQTLGH